MDNADPNTSLGRLSSLKTLALVSSTRSKMELRMWTLSWGMEYTIRTKGHTSSSGKVGIVNNFIFNCLSGKLLYYEIEQYESIIQEEIKINVTCFLIDFLRFKSKIRRL